MLDSEHIDPSSDRVTDMKKLKERLAFLNNKEEKTQEEMDEYISSLTDEQSCKHMIGVRDIINLCNCHLFECKFKSQERFKFEDTMKPECRREDILKLKKIL